MMAVLLFLLLVALLFGVGSAIHFLWFVAVVALIMWLIGFAVRPRGGRWYYW